MERGEVVNVACRSYFHDFIVTGDSRGRLRLFKYPCTVAKVSLSLHTVAKVTIILDTELILTLDTVAKVTIILR